MWHCVLWPSPLWKPWVCHWRWGCTPAAERGPETPLPAPPQWNAALRDTRTRKVIMTHFFFFFSGLVKLALLKTTPNLRCEHREAYRRMCGPGWEAVCMCAGQRRLWCPDSWWGEAETAGTHSKPDEHPSAGGGWLLAAGPAIMTHI